MDRMFHRIKLLEMIEQNYDGVYQTNAIVFGFSVEEPFKVMVYLPESKLVLPIYLVHKKLHDQYRWTIGDGSYFVYSSKHDTQQVHRFELYQEINVEIRSRLGKGGFWDKILVRVNVF